MMTFVAGMCVGAALGAGVVLHWARVRARRWDRALRRELHAKTVVGGLLDG